jgi:pantoate--beta-alanine ligase
LLNEKNIWHEVPEMTTFLSDIRNSGGRIGFVPTMGALHQGHLSLIESSRNDNDVTVCSIFVNPTQFNNREDYKLYPRDVERDITMLRKAGCEAIFIPDEKTIYPQVDATEYHFAHLETVMEGIFRPGHFRGVAMVVRRLFDLVKPHCAYFGEKDYQQLMIIKALAAQYHSEISIIPCPTTRENDGLAMSSRNQRLGSEAREMAALIPDTLFFIRTKLRNSTAGEIRNFVKNTFSSNAKLKLEYFDIADPETLESAGDGDIATGNRAFIAVWIGGVRLIDNIQL